MPVHCPISIANLSTEEFGKLDFQVMGHAFAAHKCLGRLADEPIYQADLTARLLDAGFDAQREVPVTISHGEFSKTFALDLVVSDKAIYETKVVTKLAPEHEAQLWNYLLMLNISHGKLINFRPSSVESKFVNAPMSYSEQRDFEVDDARWRGANALKEYVLDLLRDWGAVLELSLYYEAIVFFLGGKERVEALVPMERDGRPLGNQRFHLIDESNAFRITAFSQEATDYQRQLERLLQHSPLEAIHWINISHRRVSLKSIAI